MSIVSLYLVAGRITLPEASGQLCFGKSVNYIVNLIVVNQNLFS